MGAGVPVASRDECVLIDTTADGRVRFTGNGGTTTWSPSMAVAYAELFERNGDEDSLCIAKQLRKAVERIGGAR